jgi:hypothetical protein
MFRGFRQLLQKNGGTPPRSDNIASLPAFLMDYGSMKPPLWSVALANYIDRATAACRRS